MKGIVILNDGSRRELPVLTSWQMTYTDGTSSDSFSAAFLWESSWESVLSRAVRFEAWDGTVQRFCGIVDEYEVNWGQEGTVAEVFGRGMSGLLMDNEVAERQYYWVYLADILKNYVGPYQIPGIQYTKNYFLTTYAVDYGGNCWDALSGFCLWAAGVQPRFLGDGTLVIAAEEGQRRMLNQDMVQSALWRQTRYGAYSRVLAKYVGTYYEDQVDNEAFSRLGGCATHRMTIPRRNRCRAGLSSPQQVLSNSMKEFRVLEVTVPELFWANPVDVVQVQLPKVGVSGAFQVVEVENGVDEQGSRCRLRMRELS